ncbi:MAG: NAD(P)/FAD-dependent oxidoreductase [Alphaproteobacteria bacterium]|nr:NAD(P)/FAD-dependent oxidoreductase [Alphaproteobacteria bacterium]
MTHMDVLIVGAGLSGIGAAVHLQDDCPGKTYTILESRDRMGGTWDLFRYPGIRSDSDMHTLGYRFKPWKKAKSIADGSSILNYVKETARDYGVEEHIRFNHRVVSASWSSDEARWTIHANHNGEDVTFTCNFLITCSGYYRYDKGHRPEFPGEERFQGKIVHPQFWPEDLDYEGKKVVVIGSGATAVTLIPAMADKTAHITMLQRSPTYYVSRPSVDRIANRLRKFLPLKWAYFLTRWKNVILQALFYRRTRTEPQEVKDKLLDLVREQVGPDVDVDTHFNPDYNPWDQRLCLVPDADFFKSLRKGDSSVVTDTIKTFDETGIELESGKHLDADIIVTATGLELLFMGGIDLEVDGREIEPHDLFNYKGIMFSGLPNLANIKGYANASWTLKADISSEYICRLINYMDKKGHRFAVPSLGDVEMTEEPFMPLSSGYVLRSIHKFPKQGSERPWRLDHAYFTDMRTLRHAPIDDGTLVFDEPPKAKDNQRPQPERVAEAAE